MRTNHSELPSYTELLRIVETEASRNVPASKKNVHYPTFDAIINLLQYLRIPTEFFTEDIKFEDLGDRERFIRYKTVFTDLTNKILEADDNPLKQGLLEKVYAYLSGEDPPQKADIIFVFGSKKTLRTEKAVSLYKAEYAPRICISGKSPIYDADIDVSEAANLAEFAHKCGVPRESIIVEEKSISMPDNVKRSLNLFEKEGYPHGSIILVNSPFSQRRGWAHFKKLSHPQTRLYRANSETAKEYSKKNWFKTAEGVRTIVKEYFGLRVSVFLNTA